jgi:hypothetical protein
MEEDVKNFIYSVLILGLPLFCIYFTLNILNWNEKKNLFSNSWFVFLAWLLSSFSVFFFYLFFGVLPTFYFIDFVMFVFSLFFVNTAAIAGVLYLKSREPKISIISNDNDEYVQRTNIKKILQTSAIVAFVNLLLITSLFLNLDTYEKIERQNREKNGKNSFGIYDI